MHCTCMQVRPCALTVQLYGNVHQKFSFHEEAYKGYRKLSVCAEKVSRGCGAKWDTFWLFLSLTSNISKNTKPLRILFRGVCKWGFMNTPKKNNGHTY